MSWLRIFIDLFHHHPIAEQLGELTLDFTEILDASHGVEHEVGIGYHFGTGKVGIALFEFFLDDGILIVEKESGEVVHFKILFALLHLIPLAELVTVADEVGSFTTHFLILVVEEELGGDESFVVNVLADQVEHLGIER